MAQSQLALSDADKSTILDAIGNIRSLLPILISLTGEDRKRLFKLGNRRVAFLQQCLRAVQQNPHIFPSTLDREKFAADVALVIALSDTDTAISILASQIDDTLMSVGSDALATSLKIYDYVKAAAKHEPGMDVLAEELAASYQNSGASHKQQPDNPA